MSRMPRIHVENALYYVTSSGDHDEPIFKEGSDYAIYADLLDRCKKQRGFKLFAFCFTQNSVNLLIEPSSGMTISQVMHDVNSNYTKYFNKKYKKAGHLFQERYRMVLIEKEPNLLNMTAYIHLRPKILNISGNIGEYKHSSFLSYLNEGSGAAEIAQTKVMEAVGPDINDEIREVLAYLNGADYRGFVEGIPLDKSKQLDKDLGKNTILGSDEFVRDIKSRIDSEKRKLREAPKHVPEPEPASLPKSILAGSPAPQPEPENAPEPEPQPEPQAILQPEAESEPQAEPEPQPEPQDVLQPESEPESEPQPEGEPGPMRKPDIVKFIVDAILAVLAIATLALFIHTKIVQIKEKSDSEIAKKEIEFNDRLVKDRQALSKDLGEKFQAEKALYEAQVARLQSEKEKAEEVLLKEKLDSATEAWLALAREKLASIKDKLIHPARKKLPDFPKPYDWCYFRGYYFRVKNIDLIKTGSASRPYAGRVNIEENLYVEKIQTPDVSDIADLLYTVSTPIKLNFEYREGGFVYTNEEYGVPSARKGWPEA
jgi:REP element-mobilizing transposase RayT